MSRCIGIDKDCARSPPLPPCAWEGHVILVAGLNCAFDEAISESSKVHAKDLRCMLEALPGPLIPPRGWTIGRVRVDVEVSQMQDCSYRGKQVLYVCRTEATGQ